MTMVQCATISLAKRKNCVFCKYWYDPGDTCIKPVSQFFVEYDSNVKKRCTIKNAMMYSMARCNKFESKF